MFQNAYFRNELEQNENDNVHLEFASVNPLYVPFVMRQIFRIKYANISKTMLSAATAMGSGREDSAMISFQ
jgi:hypothetical protein